MRDSIIIVGGGPVGSVLALLLAKEGKACTVLEARKQGAAHADKRALALSYGSRRILEKLGVWQSLAHEATAINTIHVSQKGSMGRTLLHAKDYQQEALGYVLSYGALSAALDQSLAKLKNVVFVFEATAQKIAHHAEYSTVSYLHHEKSHTLDSNLIVLADGGRSVEGLVDLERETKEYGHDALISKVHAELPHNNIAYERFTPTGPIALLPNGKSEFSLVWTGEKALIEKLLAESDEVFLQRFHEQFGDRVGKFLSVDRRMSFPLRMSALKNTENNHLVVIGNAAQTMHPVAGQGFNVGLRDAEALAQHIQTHTNLSKQQMLSAYRASRQRDTKGGLMFTDFLVNVFSNDILGVSAMRASGLGLLDVLTPIKRHLVSKMSFGK